MPKVSAVSESQQSGWNHIDALIDIGPYWNLLVPERNTIYYSFSTTEGIDPKHTGIAGSLTAFNATQQAATLSVMSYLTQITGIQFAQVNDGNKADLHFANTNIVNPDFAGLTQWNNNYRYDGAQNITSFTVQAYVYVDTAEFGQKFTQPKPGNYAYELMLHEFGHVLGLKHPFADGIVLPRQVDNTDHTLMSYTDIGVKDHYSPYDIAALNWLYGGDGLGGALGVGAAGRYLMTTDLNDVLLGSNGNDVLDGLAGIDTANYLGSRINYRIQKQNNSFSVSSAREGTDKLMNIERVQFSDMSVSLTVQDLAKTINATQLKNLEELYLAFFNRVPDADGLSYWISQLKSGSSIQQIADSFYQAGLQFSAQTGYTSTMSHSAFVNVIYRNVLGRPEGADIEGLTYWSTALDTGRESYGSLVASILASAHGFKGDQKWGWVADLLDNKIHVAHVFAVDAGLNYNTSEDAILYGMAIAGAITPSGFDAAIKLIGLPPDQLNFS